MKAMRKIVSSILAVAMLAICAIPAFAASELVLSDTTRVNVDNTSTDIYAKPTSDEYHVGVNNYIHMYTEGDSVEINKSFTEALTAGTYTLTMHGKGTGSLWYYQNWGTEWAKIDFAAEGEDLGNGWKKYTRTINVDGDNDTGFLLYDGAAFDICLDNISLVDENGVEYVVDGGFDNPSSTNVSHNEENRYARIETEKLEADNIYSLHLYNATTNSVEFSQNFTETLPAGTYTLTAYMKGMGSLWYYQNWGSEWAKFDLAYGTADENGWCKFEKELAVDGDGDTSFLFYTSEAADLYIDDISVVGTNGVNFVIDGGFGEVTVVGGDEPEEPVTPPEEIPVLSDTTKVNIENTENRYAELVDTHYYVNGNNYIHMYNPEGSLEINKRFTEALTAGTYTLTMHGKGTGSLWYYQNWGTEWAKIDFAAEGEDLGNGWKKYTRTINVDGDNDTGFLLYDGAAFDICLDNISLVDENGVEYVVDGGFDNPLSTTVNGANDSRYAKIETEVGEADNTYSMHVYTTGDGIEFSQDFSEVLPTGTYTLTAYMKGTGAVWYYNRTAAGEWSSEWAKFDLAYGTADANGWCKFEKTFDVTREGNTNFLFCTEGECDFYIDDISLVDANGVNYAIYGGFVKPVTPDEPDEPDVPEVPVADYEISTPVFSGLTSDGKIQEGKVEISVEIKNNKMGNDFNPIVIATLYDGGILKVMEYMQQTVVETANSNVLPGNEFNISIDVPAVTETTVYEIKVMYWDGFDTLMPLGAADTVK